MASAIVEKPLARCLHGTRLRVRVSDAAHLAALWTLENAPPT